MSADKGRFNPHPGFAADDKRLKRFYTNAGTAPGASGYCVTLDGRTIKTPARRELALPTEMLARAVAAEWQAQGEHVLPASMPLTRLANTAIDGVIGREAEVRADIVKYAGNDLICYLADGPQALCDRQTEGWGPIHDWARDTHGIALKLAAGVMPVEQDTDTSTLFAALLEPFDAMALAGLHTMTTLTGSALLALAVAHRHIGSAQAWTLAHIDEDFQIEQWGDDHEASQRRAARWLEMEAAALLSGAAPA